MRRIETIIKDLESIVVDLEARGYNNPAQKITDQILLIKTLVGDKGNSVNKGEENEH